MKRLSQGSGHVCVVPQFETTINMGIALLLRHVLELELASGTIKAVPLADGEPSRDLYLIQHKDRYLSRASQAFVELLFN